MKRFEDDPVVQQFQDKDKDKILNYIRLAYDKDSALNVIENLSEKKSKAMEMSGIDRQEITSMQNEDVNELIFTYLGVYSNDNNYHNLISNQHLYWQMQEIMMSPLDVKSDPDVMLKCIILKDTISEKSGKLLARINKQKKEIWKTEDVEVIADNMIRKTVAIKSAEQRLKKSA